MTVRTDAIHTRLVCDLDYHSGTVQIPTQPLYILHKLVVPVSVSKYHILYKRTPQMT